MQVIWRVWHEENWNIKLDWTAFTDKGTLPQELEFHELASVPGNSVNNLLDWLIEAWTQQWQVVNEVKMPKILWFTAEGIQSLNEMETWDRIY